MGAAQLILFGEVCARRFCCKNGLRLREGCLENFSHRGRHRFQMHAIPKRLNPPGKPIHCDCDGRSEQIAQTGIPSRAFATSIKTSFTLGRIGNLGPTRSLLAYDAPRRPHQRTMGAAPTPACPPTIADGTARCRPPSPP
jgi:hypothetical protein